MAIDSRMIPAVRRVVQAFRRFAQKQGWARDDYRILVDTNPDWGRIHVLFLAKSFPNGAVDHGDDWLTVFDFVEKDLEKDAPDLVDAINLVLRTFDQVNEGGLYSISPEYIDLDEMLIP